VSLSEYIQDVSEASFEQDVVMRSHEVPVVVDFWAPWCGPCKMLGPMLERLAIEGGGRFRLARVNVDENPNLAVRFGVQGIPAVKAFRDGEVAGQFVGAQPEGVVRRFVDNLAPSPATAAVAQGLSLLTTRHWDQAEEAFRDVLVEDDTNAPAALGLLKTQLAQGKGGEALRTLQTFPSGTEWAAAQKLKPLAELLVEAEKAEVGPDGEPLAAQLHQAARLIARGNLEASMDGLLDILRQDKRYRAGLPKDVMLGLFTLLGDQDPLTRQYRDELASVLF
jgi:putative thioredoxin